MSTATVVKYEYACAHHPRLGPNDWHTLELNKPVLGGAAAALVCQFSCPARETCPVSVDTATAWTDTICGEGWFQHNGTFVPYRPGYLELYQAAAYVGVVPESFRYLMRKHGIRPALSYKTLRYLHMVDVQKLAREAGPLCGTAAKLSLHEMRGDLPCVTCEQLLVLAKR